LWEYPDLAKTLLVSTIAEVLDLEFKRIQFTPDLMPSDISGAEILDESRQFRFLKGPIFSNIVLADEINRTPPKTQAALTGSDARTCRNRWWHPAPASVSVFRTGNTEPD
jgi:MoxR-like ATPase